MTNNQILPTDAIITTETKPVTTSLKVAEAFGKEHKNVIAKLKTLECSSDFTELHFKLCSKISDLQNGKPIPYYQLDFSGFMFLVMGFTGKKAAKIKEAYINAFDAMAEKLSGAQYGTLNPAQQRQIQQKIGVLVHTQPHELRPSLYGQIYGKLKNTFGVAKYEQIPTHLFNQALVVIDQFKLPALTHEPTQSDFINIELAESSILKSTPVTAFNYGDTVLPTPLAGLLNQLMQAENSDTPIKIKNVYTAARDLDGLMGLLQQYRMVFNQITAISEPMKRV